MDLIADGLLIATALTAALYCLVLSQRLRKLTDSQSGIPAQIQSLNKALEETKAALDETRNGIADARGTAKKATESLAREVWIAKQTAAELDRACTEAETTLGKLSRRTPRKPSPGAQDEAAMDEAFEQTSDITPPDQKVRTPANLMPDDEVARATGEDNPIPAGSRDAPADLPTDPKPAGEELPAGEKRQNDGMLRMQRMAI